MEDKPVIQTETILKVDQRDSPMTGVYTWRNPKNGFFVMDLKYTASPRKRSPEWLAQTKAGMPTAEFNREYGEAWNVYDGKPVYQDFDEDLHVMRGNIIVPRRTRLISGWDGGPSDVNLAWALAVSVFDGLGMIIIDEYQVDDGDIKSFVEVVQSRLQLEWFKISGFSLHFTDPSAFTQSSVVKRAMTDVMRDYGFAPIPSEVSFGKRRVAVETLLMTPGETIGRMMIPRFRVHERCKLSIEALKGGYQYQKANAGVGGQYKEMPEKNRFSHIANAIEYIAARLTIANVDIPYEGRRLPDHEMV